MPAIRPAGLRNPSKLSRSAVRARRNVALRGGSYLDICHTFFPEAAEKMSNCMNYWVEEERAGEIRYRGYGCGERRICPTDGSYRQAVLAKNAYDDMMAVQTYFDIIGSKLECYGFMVRLTLPKQVSEKIDADLGEKGPAWWQAMNNFDEDAAVWIKENFGSGTGWELATHLTGESDPGEPHYHQDIYVTPFRQVAGDKFEPLNHWRDVNAGRRSWTKLVNRRYGLKLLETDIKINYIDNDRKLQHKLNYQTRHILQDLWDGWRQVQDGQLDYVYGHGKRKKLPIESVHKALDRSMKIPSHFKRIRWGGIFADSLRSKTMKSFYLEPEEIKPNDWQYKAGFHFLAYLESGMLLKRLETGEVVEVPEKFIDYRPNGRGAVTKRTRWRVPAGGKINDDVLDRLRDRAGPAVVVKHG